MRTRFPANANRDDTVNIVDLSILFTNFDKSGMAWSQGDFSADGTVNIVDLSVLLTNFDKTVTVSVPAIHAVAEPLTAALLLAALFAGVVMLKHNRRFHLTPAMNAARAS